MKKTLSEIFSERGNAVKTAWKEFMQAEKTRLQTLKDDSSSKSCHSKSMLMQAYFKSTESALEVTATLQSLMVVDDGLTPAVKSILKGECYKVIDPFRGYI